jgi:hypothetical protein
MPMQFLGPSAKLSHDLSKPTSRKNGHDVVDPHTCQPCRWVNSKVCINFMAAEYSLMFTG